MPLTELDKALDSAYETAAWLRANGSSDEADGLIRDVNAIRDDMHSLGIV